MLLLFFVLHTVQRSGLTQFKLAVFFQDGSVLHVSTGLTDASPPPLLLQPKEEEEAVEIMRAEEERALREEETAGRAEEDELCGEGVTDGGGFYEMEVKLPDSDEEPPPPSPPPPPSDFTEVPRDVTSSDPSHQPPEFISLVSGAAGQVEGRQMFGDVVSSCRSLCAFRSQGRFDCLETAAAMRSHASGACCRACCACCKH